MYQVTSNGYLGGYHGLKRVVCFVKGTIRRADFRVEKKEIWMGAFHTDQHPFHRDPFACKGLNKCESINCTKANPEIKPRVIIYILNNIEGCALHIPVLLRLFHHKRFISSINYLVHLS